MVPGIGSYPGRRTVAQTRVSCGSAALKLGSARNSTFKAADLWKSKVCATETVKTSVINLQPKLDLARNISLAGVPARIVCSYDRGILVPACALGKDRAVKDV